jgi:hypothetical protein
MQRLLGFAPVALVLLTVTGCATMNVSSHVARGLDFTRYHTYDWGPADALPTGDPRLDRDPFFQDHMQGAVEKQLAAKGLQQSTLATADLVIHYHASINQRIDVNRLDRQYGYCQGDDCQRSGIEYEAGTIVLDVIDARTKKLIWRGWAQDSVEDVPDDRDRMARKIEEAVTRMLELFPRPL